MRACRPVNGKTVYYEIVLRHDVATYGWFWLAALLLLIPPIFSTIRAGAFETRRWVHQRLSTRPLEEANECAMLAT